MAELQQQEKLQPALLDRLTDESPAHKSRRLHRSPARKPGSTEAEKQEDGNSSDSSLPSTQVSGDDTKSGRVPVFQANPLVVTSRRLKEYVKRDLSWLLNTVNLESVVDLEACPRVAESVLNYGMPDLTGTTVNNISTKLLERKVMDIILKYEPRIIEKSLSVRISKKDEMSNRALQFEIECDIWAQPVPEHVRLNSELDLTSGSFDLRDSTIS